MSIHHLLVMKITTTLFFKRNFHVNKWMNVDFFLSFPSSFQSATKKERDLYTVVYIIMWFKSQIESDGKVRVTVFALCVCVSHRPKKAWIKSNKIWNLDSCLTLKGKIFRAWVGTPKKSQKNDNGKISRTIWAKLCSYHTLNGLWLQLLIWWSTQGKFVIFNLETSWFKKKIWFGCRLFQKKLLF